MVDGYINLEVFIRRSFSKLISSPIKTSTVVTDKDRVYIDGAFKCYYLDQINRDRGNLIAILYQNVTDCRAPIIFRGYYSGLIMRIESEFKLNSQWAMKITCKMLNLLKQAISGWKFVEKLNIDQYTEGCSYRLNMLTQKGIHIFIKDAPSFHHEDLWWRTLFGVMGLKYGSTLITLSQLVPELYVLMMNDKPHRLIMILPQDITLEKIIQQTILMI